MFRNLVAASIRTNSTAVRTAIFRTWQSSPRSIVPRAVTPILSSSGLTARTLITRASHGPSISRLGSRVAHTLSTPLTTIAPVAIPSQKPIAVWLFGCSGLVFGMVMLGGVTRLTGSGLSMTHWTPHGGRPPMTDEEWEAEFNLYKQFPEYQRSDKKMTVNRFKFIYFMEWSHRMFGRLIGVAYAVPLVYFLARKRLTPTLKKQLAVISGLMALQGGLGWYMVKSGLSEKTLPEQGETRVSPYRLSAHLMTAVAIYGTTLWSALSLVVPTPAAPVKVATSAGILVAAVTTTILSGAFVAGNRAGLVYNEFPLMGGRVVPSDYITDIRPFWKNFTENLSNVQFNHRAIAIATFLWSLHTVAKEMRYPTSPQSRAALIAVAVAACTQVGLGITTLLMYVPVDVAAAHQAGSLVLFSTSLWLLRAVKTLPK
eukprot:TRINITY_DN3412_c0_g1_i10.p1 TRINITY_DN3412_c0_g1~~TRINITY_DN3412_c0_g1_i10.p1  ORF type:complete len:428 (+),score=68.05 TRINITY_DN3412_c0_g1_i10:1322-2605(+)